GASTGLVNWYDLTFDPEGYFDGRPSLFVTSVDSSDPNKNVIYRIGPDGSFMGAFVQFTTEGLASMKFNLNPTSILVPPVEDQSFLRGLIAGSGISSSTGGEFAALFFNANAYTPGQDISSASLPVGVSQETGLVTGPQVGLTAANADYPSRVYSAFTDFGTPASSSSPAQPGPSGVQGLNGEYLITGTTTATGSVSATTPPAIANYYAPVPLTPDAQPQVTTPFRRFEDVAFDQYGYFSQGITTSTTTSSTGATITNAVTNSAGSLFVADLGTGLSVQVTPQAPLSTTPINIPIQGPGTVGVTTDAAGNVIPITTNGNTTDGSNLGGRILRITPAGVVTTFAQGFHTSGNQDASSFVDSSLSISFSADGTILYASDDDGIWQFKTTASLASSSTGSYVGLNDLRSLGVPYEGQDTAVAIVDTGVDAFVPSFRGRVSLGYNVITNGLGSTDTSPGTATTTSTTTSTTSTTLGATATTPLNSDGHGTTVAGVVAQFVPQATLEPVDIFNPFQTPTTTTTSSSSTTTGTSATISTISNAATTTNAVYQGFGYVAKSPYVDDPVRPNQVDRVVAATFGFGTTETFDSEGSAYRQYPQIVIAFKNQLKKFRSLGIAPIAATGQFGAPLAAGAPSTTSTTSTTTTTSSFGTNNATNATVGDVNGIAFPAILNEVISVTGIYPFPYTYGPTTTPNLPPTGVAFGTVTPFLIGTGFGGIPPTTSSTSTTSSTNTAIGTGEIGALTAADLPQGIFAGRILGSNNRNVTTDYAAPAIDVPTFRRRLNVTTSTSGTTTGTTPTFDPYEHLTFQDAGTSLSAAIVTGAYDVVASALDYWTKLNQTGVTSDAYLTQPVGVNTLNFGPHAFKDLSAYNNPDGINAILAWTSVPATERNDGLSSSTPPYLFGGVHYASYSGVNVANAIAAIEGEIALQYLIDHNVLPIIDANKNGIITAQEIQDFVDESAKIGMPEAGAMARLLGGTARPPGNSITSSGEMPDLPDVLQRRFNFFDYAADGQLNGSITIDELKMLAHTLLPKPDSFVVNDRQRASANGFLVEPTAIRDYTQLQHIQPTYQFVPKGALLKYRNISPARFKVNQLKPGDTIFTQFPIYALFSGTGGNSLTISNATLAASPATSSTTPNPQGSASTAPPTASGSATGATPSASALATTAGASNTPASPPAATNGSTAPVNSGTSTSSGSAAPSGTPAPVISSSDVPAVPTTPAGVLALASQIKAQSLGTPETAGTPSSSSTGLNSSSVTTGSDTQSQQTVLQPPTQIPVTPPSVPATPPTAASATPPTASQGSGATPTTSTKEAAKT
ncbi:MAG: hypothetical protein JO252_06495, partial [Planctomycetaceae bacterium]|nr:hypothetical protein [Planctomycetaceae bacterium]